jgi:hypothetical protein
MTETDDKSETDDKRIKGIRLMVELKAIMNNIDIAKLLKDYKLVRSFNKELTKKRAEIKKLQKEQFIEELAKHK